MQHVNDQHIVPQFLLKNFSTDGLKVWSFDKQAIPKRWRNTNFRSIISTPTEKHIYDKQEGNPDDSLEYFLRDLENLASPIIHKLVKRQDLGQLSSNDKLMIANFVSSQMARTKGGRKELDNLKAQLNGFTESKGFRMEDFNIKSFWLDQITKSDKYVKYLLNKSWSLNICDDDYYISDNPVVKYNTTNFQPHRGNLGIDSKGIEIYLPLSSSVMLCLYCAETFPHENIVVKASPENIEYFNWLQVKYSDRFIYAKKEGFELIYDMLKKEAL